MVINVTTYKTDNKLYVCCAFICRLDTLDNIESINEMTNMSLNEHILSNIIHIGSYYILFEKCFHVLELIPWQYSVWLSQHGIIALQNGKKY